MNKTLLSNTLLFVLASTVIQSTPALAQEGLSANVAITNNYLWRGLEQTNGKTALSGGIDYSASSGFYAGTWVSNADWAPGMTYELDLYGGFTGSISSSVSYDVGFIYFAYPDEDSGDADFSELYGNLSFDALTLGVAVLADGTGGDFGDSLYGSVDYEFSLSNDAVIALHIGSYTGDWIADESIDYGISFAKSGFTLGVSDTDLQGDDVKVYVSYAIDLDI
jgi:uncharacterized protein (TIGR02001 family)